MFRRVLRLAATAAVSLVAAVPIASAQSAAGPESSFVPRERGASRAARALPLVPSAPAHPAASTRDPASAPAVGPRLDASSVAVGAQDLTQTPANDADAAALQRRSGLQQSQVLMIVGGAAFLAGAIIGDDAGTIFMIGGAAVALYGLYQYLQ
jgi:hypothetical protein